MKYTFNLALANPLDSPKSLQFFHTLDEEWDLSRIKTIYTIFAAHHFSRVSIICSA